MKGLEIYPNQSQLIQAIDALNRQTNKLTTKQLAQFIDWARIEPRLAETLVHFFEKNWRKINPLKLNAYCKKNAWPSAIGLILEHTQTMLPKEHFAVFKLWKQLVTQNISSAKNELFFINAYPIAGKIIKHIISMTTNPYLKWGFIGSDFLVNKNSARQNTQITKKRRQAILNQLLSKMKKISVNDYIAATKNSVSRRTAERDLKTHPKLKPSGYTRGRTYSLS